MQYSSPTHFVLSPHSSIAGFGVSSLGGSTFGGSAGFGLEAMGLAELPAIPVGCVAGWFITVGAGAAGCMATGVAGAPTFPMGSVLSPSSLEEPELPQLCKSTRATTPAVPVLKITSHLQPPSSRR